MRFTRHDEGCGPALLNLVPEAQQMHHGFACGSVGGHLFVQQGVELGSTIGEGGDEQDALP